MQFSWCKPRGVVDLTQSFLMSSHDGSLNKPTRDHCYHISSIVRHFWASPTYSFWPRVPRQYASLHYEMAQTAASSSAHANRPPTMVLGANYGDDVDPSRWVVIYPPYIDSTRKEKQVCFGARAFNKAYQGVKRRVPHLLNCVYVIIRPVLLTT